MNYENKVLNYMKDNSDSITVEELNKLNIPRITLTRLTDKKLIEYKCLIDDKVIKIMAFSKYSVIAEKFKTLIETLETDTRAKDFYDIYKLMINNIDKEKLYKAIYNTFERRNTLILLEDLENRFNIIKESLALQEYWNNYQRKNYYARNISYEDFVNSVKEIVDVIISEKQPV